MDFATCKEKLTDQIKENDRLCKIIRIKKQESLSIEKELIALREENERLREILRDVIERIPEHIPLGTMNDIHSALQKKESE